MTHYLITELKEKVNNGVVHSIKIDGIPSKTGLYYEPARLFVETRIKPGDTIAELYLSSGNQVEYDYDTFLAKQKELRQWYEEH